MCSQERLNLKQVPLLDLQKEYEEIKGEIDESLLKTVSGARYILGPEVEKLEAEIARYLGVKYCVGVASGTDALLLSLRALAVTRKKSEFFAPDDEIITTPFTFTATGSTILRAGAKPVFVDIDPVTFNIDPQQVKAAITNKTVGIIPVHLYGQPCPMDKIMEIAEKNGLFVLEDAAQSFGAKWQGKKVGGMGTLAAFSFFPSKNLGCFGDGGAVATSDAELAEKVKMLRTHGGKDKYNVEYLGYNSRLDTIQAAVLLVKLKHVDRLNCLRREIASYYNEHLKGLAWLSVPGEAQGAEHIFHQYTVRIGGGKRDTVQAILKEKGISTAVYYPVPLHEMKVFAGRCRINGSLPYTVKACQEVLSLPVEPLLQEKELKYVVDSIRNIKL